MTLGLLVGLFFFAVFVGCHLGVVRWAAASTKARLHQRAFLVGMMAIAATVPPIWSSVDPETLRQGGWWMGILWGELTYLGLFCVFTPFYYVVVASLSVRTIVMLLRRPQHRMPLTALREAFVSRDLVGGRLTTMTGNGFLVARGEGYALAPKGRLVAVVFSRLKRFWALGAGG